MPHDLKSKARLGRVIEGYCADVWRNTRKHSNQSVIASLFLTFFPLQPRRKSSLPDGSAAKVFEPRSQKNQIKNSKVGRVLRRPSGRFGFREFGDVGVAFFWLLFLARQEK
ncbi:MAG: hypothetical protein K0M58_01380 [Thiobacillus sp.]|nr:hypothetical protein [Thiobacillus sp.]